MGQGEEISRQEKVVSSWSGSGGKSLFVCPQRSGQEAQVFASSLSGRLVSWGAGIGRCDDWALMGRVSSVTGVRQEVWTVLMFRDSLLAASHHNQHSWSHSFCFISSQLSLVPSFLIPMSTRVKANNTSTKYNKMCRRVLKAFTINITLQVL